MGSLGIQPGLMLAVSRMKRDRRRWRSRYREQAITWLISTL